MCGIAGIFMRKGVNSAISPDVIRKMTDQLEHRGPDDSGFHIEGRVALGHRRLSIIDLDTGKQPIYNEDRTMAIIFNGEIYNYIELQDLLIKKGHRFQTRSDTEVILHAYEEWGTDSPTYLRGMFAYAIWDSKREELFLARDRIGKKPVYYLETPEYFIFASELKSLLQFPGVPLEINLEALSDYLSFLYVPGPKCIFKRMKKLLPAHSLVISKHASSLMEYWDIHFRPDEGLQENTVQEELSRRIREAVQIRLKSEVPLGAFLSGGLDSSVVVANMSSLMEKPVEAISIGFIEDSFNELRFAQEVARELQVRHHEFIVDSVSESMIDKLACYYDEPFADSSSIPTYQVCRVTRQMVTVALSGDGGDENFAGYDRYFFDVLENRVRTLFPGQFHCMFFGGLSSVYPKADWLPRVFRAKTFLKNVSLPAERAYFRTMSAFQEELKKTLFRPEVLYAIRGYDSFHVLEPYFSRVKENNILTQIQYVDMKTYLPDDILTKVDRASMANSLEVRSPLLDHRLMEWVATLPSCWKLKGREGKYIFKKASEGLIPRRNIYRAKMGFSIPLDHWFRNQLKPLAEEMLLHPKTRVYNYFEPSIIRKIWKDHQAGWKNYGTHLYSLLSLEAWHRKYLSS